jgi:hypothetical protein
MFEECENLGVYMGFLGSFILVIFILHLVHSEKFERIGIHVLKLLSLISKSAERRSISKEVAYIISTSLTLILLTN